MSTSERWVLAEAFDRFAGIDLLATVARTGETDRDGLASAVADADLRVAPDDTWADLFSRVLVARIERGLRRARAVRELRDDNAALDARVVERALQLNDLKAELDALKRVS